MDTVTVTARAAASRWSFWLSTTATILYYLAQPVLFLLKALLYILLLLATPFLYIGRVLVDLSLIPYRIFLSFEALWYFLGTAVCIGLALGLILHFAFRGFVAILGLDQTPPSKPKPIPPTGHDAISYRKARAEKKQKQLDEQQRLAAQARLIASQPLLQEAVREARKLASPTAVSPVSPHSPSVSASRAGLLQETILEHSDEDDEDSF